MTLVACNTGATTSGVKDADPNAPSAADAGESASVVHCKQQATTVAKAAQDDNGFQKCRTARNFAEEQSPRLTVSLDLTCTAQDSDDTVHVVVQFASLGTSCRSPTIISFLETVSDED